LVTIFCKLVADGPIFGLDLKKVMRH